MLTSRIQAIVIFAFLWLLPIVAADNLLKNGNFETVNHDGIFADWGYFLEKGVYAGPSARIQTLEGKNCLELRCSDVRQSGAVIQNCEVVPGKRYWFGGLFLGRSGFARVNCHDATGKFIGCVIQIDLTCEEETYTWSPLGSSFVAGDNVASVEVIFDMWARICKGPGYVDCLFFGEQPSTIPERPVASGTVKDGKVELNWQPCANASKYIIYRSYFSDQGKGEAIALVTENSWEDCSIDERAARCSYRVMALDDACQASELSEPVELKIREFQRDAKTNIGIFSPFNKIRRWEFFPANPGCAIELDLAKNETAACQIAIQNLGRELNGVDLTISELKINGVPLAPKQGEVEVFQIEYVHVDKPSVMRERLSSLPGYLPDPLLPWRGNLTVPQGENRGIWLKLRTTAECPAGKITGFVIVREQNQVIAKFPLVATVYDFELPEAPSYQSSFQIWYDQILEAFGLQERSEESEGIFDKYIEILLAHRLNPGVLRYSLDDPKAQKWLTDPRLVSLSLPTGDFSKLEQLQKSLKENYGIQGYVYVQDEPTPGDFQACRDAAALVHKNRDVPYILTTAPNPELFGVVDIWVPSLQEFFQSEAEQRRHVGEHIWWYTSLFPRSPFPTFLVDDCGTSPRALAWLQAKYNIEGLLYWDICLHRRLGDDNSYNGQVWDTPRLYCQGNGDGFLVYPGKQRGIDGPVTSVRLEIILEANEELEYFAMYRRLLKAKGFSENEIARKISEITEPAASNLIIWNESPEIFDCQRKKLAQEILNFRLPDLE